MLKLFTEIEDNPQPYRISYREKGLLVGSCFSGNIGDRMRWCCFPVEVNPFGVIYNPISIIGMLEMARQKRRITHNELVFSGGVYGSIDFHTSLCDPDPQCALEKMNNAVDLAHKALCESDYLIITLGTSIVHHYLPEDRIAANCNKLPSTMFHSRKIDVDEVVDTFAEIIEHDFYKHKRFIFTLSPVRHTKSGLVENGLSKAVLRVAIDGLCARYPRVCYFPAYELMMDELRDYRFYEADLLHPSFVAIEYIWERFKRSFVSQESIDIMQKIMKIRDGINHRPQWPRSDTYRNFLQNLLLQAHQLKQQFPFIDISEPVSLLNALSQKNSI